MYGISMWGAHTHSLRYAIAYFTAYPVIMNFHSRVIRHSQSVNAFFAFCVGFIFRFMLVYAHFAVRRSIAPPHFTATLDVIGTHKRKMPATTIKRRNNTLLFSCNCVFGCFLWFHSSSSSSASVPSYGGGGCCCTFFLLTLFFRLFPYAFDRTISVLLV